MSQYIVVFASLNQTALLKRALYRQGIFSDMLRTPHCLASTGCSFALRCGAAELSALEEQCRILAISHGGVFEVEAESGTYSLRIERPARP